MFDFEGIVHGSSIRLARFASELVARELWIESLNEFLL